MPRIILSCLFIVMVGACAPRAVLDREETTLVGWWIEDTCRGVARSPAELQTENASQGLQRIAESIPLHGGGGPLSHRLAARRARWPVVSHFLRTGVLVPAEDGLVTVASTAGGEEASLARSVASDENKDRLSIEVVVLSKAEEDTDGSRRLRGALREARSTADRQSSPDPLAAPGH